jgi:hypothetical protein
MDNGKEKEASIIMIQYLFQCIASQFKTSQIHWLLELLERGFCLDAAVNVFEQIVVTDPFCHGWQKLQPTLISIL